MNHDQLLALTMGLGCWTDSAVVQRYLDSLYWEWVDKEDFKLLLRDLWGIVGGRG